MTVIKKYLDSIGVTYSYKRSYIDRHYGGRSFYNDGLYSVDVYELSNGFEIHHKCTGRPLFWLYKDNKPIRCDYSQRHFIDFVLREEFKYESLCEGETK